MKKVAAYLSLFFGTILIISLFTFFTPKAKIKKYNPHEGVALASLPTGFNTLFAGSGECEFCHGDPNNGGNTSANTDSLGNDISPATMWKGTMMANSAKDPFWRAKVSHEGLENPAIKDDIENVCTKCHAPNGHFNAIHNGDDKYTIADMVGDPLALDGVSCTSCHSMTDEGFGTEFSANITYDTNHNVYGPYTDPFPNPMQNMIGFTPNYGSHINQSEQCGICHTLITHPVDTNSNPTGTFFVEQAIYHEWLNSSFSQNDETCQSCHMRRTDESIVISNRPPWLDARTPFGKHELVGGNTFMLKLFQKYTDSLGIAADSALLQKVIERSEDILQNRTLELTLDEVSRDQNTISYDLLIENKAGHKFPSGYPSRRAIVEFVVEDEAGDTLFHTGKFDEDYRVVNEDASFEPHHTTISSEQQVQIYEMVMGDLQGNTTTVLEYAYEHLKDNRLTPKGYVSSHSAYDTVKIVGDALNDGDFNSENGTEGSGTDKLRFNIPLNGYTGDLKVTAKVHYQSVPPKWLDEMFAHSSPEIDRFKGMYESMSPVPEVVAVAANYNLTGIEDEEYSDIRVYPNPTTNLLNVDSPQKLNSIVIYNSDGEIVRSLHTDFQNIMMPKEKGVYFVSITTKGKEQFVKKIVKY